MRSALENIYLLRSTYLRVAVVLAAITGLAYLLFSSRFGLYSDDVFLYSLLARHDGNVLRSAFNFSLCYAGAGRPLGQVALMLLFWLGNALAGVKGLYLLGGALLWVQVMLAFLSLRHFASTSVAFLAAAAYIVFPADVARFLPVHAFDSQFAAVAFWGALLFFLANRYLLATLLISSTLLFYETHWLLAWGFPILLIAKGKSIKELLRAGSRYFFYLMVISVFTAEAYYRLLAWCNVDVVFNHADYRLLGRRALNMLKEYSEVNLFLRGLVPQLGFKTEVVEYSRAERFAGKSKYSFRKMLGLAWDGITSFSTTPLRWITVLGFTVASIAFALGLWVLWVALIRHKGVPGWASTVLPMYFLGGVQLVATGVIGEYVAKIYMEAKRRPRYIIEKII